MRRILVLVALLGLTAGCGARLTDEQRTAALGRGTQQTGAPASAETTLPGAAPAPTGDTTATTAAPAPGQQQAAPQAGAPQAPGGPCQPQGGGDPGVTPSEIVIGNVSTISGPVPGLGQTAQNGVKAYVNYINSKGGVCGRKVKLLATDDRLDTGTNRSEHERMLEQVFGFAGSWSVVDDGGASVLAGTNVPDVTLALNDQRLKLPNNFSPNPIDPAAAGNGNASTFRWMKANKGVSKAAIVYPAQAAASKRALAFEADMKAAGLQVVVKSEVAITQTDYTGVATQIKNAGADLVITALEIGGMARLAQALKQQDYVPKVPFYGAQAYSKKFLQQAGAAAEGTTIAMKHAPVEDPSMAAFSQWYQRTNPGGDPDFFAITSWAATELLLQSIAEAGPTPTRDAVLAKLRTKTDFTAGGVLAPRTNPAQKRPSECFVIVTVRGGRWVREAPASGFQC